MGGVYFRLGLYVERNLVGKMPIAKRKMEIRIFAGLPSQMSR